MNQQITSSGISFSGLLAILFIGLKLTNYIDWPWWLVLAPLWAPLVLLLIVLLIAGIFLLVLKVFNAMAGKLRR